MLTVTQIRTRPRLSVGFLSFFFQMSQATKREVPRYLISTYRQKVERANKKSLSAWIIEPRESWRTPNIRTKKPCPRKSRKRKAGRKPGSELAWAASVSPGSEFIHFLSWCWPLLSARPPASGHLERCGSPKPNRSIIVQSVSLSPGLCWCSSRSAISNKRIW